MDPNSWGPSAWAVLHKSALHADFKSKREDWSVFVEKFLKNLPCDSCQEHASDYFKMNPYKPENSAFEWTVQLHNHVNLRLGKPKHELESARTHWSQDKCTQSCTKKSATSGLAFST